MQIHKNDICEMCAAHCVHLCSVPFFFYWYTTFASFVSTLSVAWHWIPHFNKVMVTHKNNNLYIYIYIYRERERGFNPLNPELNPICYLLALLGAHHFLHVSRIRVKLLTFRLLILYIHGAPILDVSRSHTTTQHSR